MRTKRQRLIKRLDKLFSWIIRERDGWKCVYCGKYYPPPTTGLHCSHYFGRTHLGTRWDKDNADSLCYGHHRYHGDNKQMWYTDFKKKQLGKRFNILKWKANSVTKYSISDLELLEKELKNDQTLYPKSSPEISPKEI